MTVSAASLRPDNSATAPWLQFAAAAASGSLGGLLPKTTTVRSKVWDASTGEAVDTKDATNMQKRKNQVNVLAQHAMERQLEENSRQLMAQFAGGPGASAGMKASRATARKKYGW